MLVIVRDFCDFIFDLNILRFACPLSVDFKIMSKCRRNFRLQLEPLIGSGVITVGRAHWDAPVQLLFTRSKILLLGEIGRLAMASIRP